MANQLNQNPIIITVALPLGYKAGTLSSLGTPGYLRVVRIMWTAPSATGDQVLIINPKTGFELYRAKATASNVGTDEQQFNQIWDDFAVPQIDSGVLRIYLG
jgi:hypothetical protein